MSDILTRMVCLGPSDHSEELPNPLHVRGFLELKVLPREVDWKVIAQKASP